MTDEEPPISDRQSVLKRVFDHRETQGSRDLAHLAYTNEGTKDGFSKDRTVRVRSRT